MTEKKLDFWNYLGMTLVMLFLIVGLLCLVVSYPIRLINGEQTS